MREDVSSPSTFDLSDNPEPGSVINMAGGRIVSSSTPGRIYNVGDVPEEQLKAQAEERRNPFQVTGGVLKVRKVSPRRSSSKADRNARKKKRRARRRGQGR